MLVADRGGLSDRVSEEAAGQESVPSKVAPRAGPELQVGQRVSLKRKHPCGSSDWTVTRVGGVVALRCVGCGRTVELSWARLNQRLRRVVENNDSPAPPEA